MDEYEVKQAVSSSPTVRIEGLTAESVAVIIRETVRANYRLDERAQEMMRDAVGQQVEALLRSEAKEQIAALVADTLEKGFAEHDRYGNASGKQITARSLILEQLTAKISNGYSQGESAHAQRIAASVISAEFEKSFKDDLKTIRDGFKSQVDDLLKGKIVTSLKEALGLH